VIEDVRNEGGKEETQKQGRGNGMSSKVERKEEGEGR
jgi:hypothetical protein